MKQLLDEQTGLIYFEHPTCKLKTMEKQIKPLPMLKELQIGDIIKFSDFGQMQTWSESNGKPNCMKPDPDDESGMTFIKIK